jgi:hypothetical protein
VELRIQLQIDYEIGDVDENIFGSLDDRYARLAKMIGSLLNIKKYGFPGEKLIP